jgi:hypothetical protein
MTPLTGRKAGSEDVDVGWVRLASDDDRDLQVLAELGDGAPRVTQGYGGWDEVARRGRTSLTTWTGRQPLAIELPIYLDNFDEGEGLPVEAAISVLEGLAGRGPQHPTGRPPAIEVDTAGVMPFDVRASEDTRWVITSLDWDVESVIVNSSGNRVRAEVTVGLLEYVFDQSLRDRAATVQRSTVANPGNARKPHVVKAGETAVSIAGSVLKDPGRWREIATLNGIGDPRKALSAGRSLKMPR